MANELPNSVDLALQQVDAKRRGFLTKLLAGGAVAAAIPAMSSVALAEDNNAKGKGKGGGKGKGDKPDAAKLAAMLIKKHDKDGDGALNQRELTAALKAMRERRANKGDGKGKGKGKGKGGQGKGKGDRG